MINVTVRRSVVASLGAAAGALAAAAFVSTAPIATADDNGIDWSSLASPAPAVTYPEVGYTNDFFVYSGSTETEYVTKYDGTGLPMTTKEPTTDLPTGTTEYGTTDSYTFEDLTSATAGYEDQGGYALADVTTATGTTDYVEPFINIFTHLG